jgi:hypothetical protein
MRAILILLFLPAFLIGTNGCKSHINHLSYSKIGEITANGWLQQVVQSELNGVTGKTDVFAPEVSWNPFHKQRLENEDRWDSWWDGESTGNWIDGYTRLAFTSHDSIAIRKSKQWIYQLIELQNNDPESYIGLYSPFGKFRWKSIISELWPQSRVFLAFHACYQATGDTVVLNSLIKASSLTVQKMGKNHPGWVKEKDTHALMIVEPMLEIYKLTGDKKYLEFSEFVFDKLRHDIDSVEAGKLYLHGPHVAENIRIPALLFASTGNERYLKISEDAIEKISAYYLNPLGVLRADEAISYAVPNRYSEYCAITEWIISLTEMAHITGKMKYADMAEKCFLNAAMAARLPDGNGIQYLSCPNHLYADSSAYFNNNQIEYSSHHWPFCCNPNAGRVIPYYINRMWLKSENGLLAMLYGPNTLKTLLGKNNTPVEIKEVTTYPFNEAIHFEVNPQKPITFSFSFRLPQWCQNPVFTLNSDTITEYKLLNNIVTINREWKSGDQIAVTFPMKVKIDFLNNDLVAVNRGPLVYSLEIPDKIKLRTAPDSSIWVTAKPATGAIWNYALWFEKKNISNCFKFESLPITNGESPWQHSPIQLTATAQSLPDWYTDGIHQPAIPPSPLYWHMFKKEKSVKITLIPCGSARVRITCFPYFLIE